MTTQKRKLSEFAQPGMGGAEQGVPAEHSQQVVGVPEGGIDREGAMAKADLYKLASYSHKLYEKIEEDTQLEAWVQAKITKAADYIASVYHYLEYEMKFSEYGHHLDNSDTLSEGQKMKIKELLAEAKGKMKALKVAQAEKISEGDMGMEEGTPCSACGGTGVEGGHEAAAGPRDVRAMAHPDTLAKADAYASKTRAAYAAHKRHAEEEEESMEESVDDEDRAPTKSKETTYRDSKGKVHKSTQHQGWQSQKADKKKDDEMDEGFESDSKEGDTFKTATGGTATKTKTGVKHSAGSKYSGKEAEKEAKEKKVDESKPSAGLSKAKKSATVKKAKAGGDIGKPGKGFAKVAAKAAKEYGSKEKGEKVAAAAMWKNIKETTAYMMEKAKAAKPDFLDMDKDGDKKEPMKKAVADKKKETVKESTDFTRMQEQLGRLNRNETHQLVESSEADQIRALTKRLLG